MSVSREKERVTYLEDAGHNDDDIDEAKARCGPASGGVAVDHEGVSDGVGVVNQQGEDGLDAWVGK